MARNKLTDLNDALFAQLERLGDEDLSSEDLQKEIERSKAMDGVAKQIIENAKLTLDVMKFTHNDLPGNKSMPAQLRLVESKEK